MSDPNLPMPDWNDYLPVTLPPNWQPIGPFVRDVATERHVVGFFRAVHARLGTAKGWMIRTRDTRNTYHAVDMNPDGSYHLERLVESRTVAGLQRRQNGVLSGGEWIPRPLTDSSKKALPSYDVEYAAGEAVLLGQVVTWPAGKVVCQSGENLLYVDRLGNVRVRVLEAPALLPPPDQVPLMRAYANEAIYGVGVYAVLDVRTLLGERPEANLRLKERLLESVVQSGPWKGAVKVNRIGYINWYFANLGLLGFVEELPDVVQAHLDLQVSKFYSSETGTGQADWQALHGTPWDNFYAWAYDVHPDPDDTFTVGVKRRADSHDSYASTFVFLAVAYARSSAAGEAWFTANLEPIKRAIYYNHLLRLVQVPDTASGYWTTTFQDRTVYPISYTMDNVEVWAALRAVNLYAAEKGLDPTFFDGSRQAEQNILAGLQAAWADVDGGKLRYLADLDAGRFEDNPLTHWYPDLTVHPVVMLWQPPLHADTALSRRRQDAALAQMTRAPGYWKTRDYDAFPWAYATAAAVRAGNHTVGRENLSFLARHFYNDVEGSLLVNEMGFLRLIQQWLVGKRTALDHALEG